jgi:hypothetical protein
MPIASTPLLLRQGIGGLHPDDPPYIVNYRGRDGRKVANDDNAHWLRPAFNQMHRLHKEEFASKRPIGSPQ